MTSHTASPNQTHVTSRRPTNWLALALFVGLLLLATGLRFYRLDAQSFWNDEGNSARLSERSLPLIIEGTASDIHPPLYYVALRGWRELLGAGEFGLRSFSAFAGVLTVAATIGLAALLLRPQRGRGAHTAVLAAGLLAALNPALIYYSQETRMYALVALLAALATLCLLRWLRTPRRLWPWGAAYVLVLTAGLYTHYFFPAVIILHAFFVMGWAVRRQTTLAFNPQRLPAAERGRRVLLTWLGFVLISVLLYLPWLPVFLRQAGGRTAVRDSFPAFAADSLRWMVLGETGPERAVWAVSAVVLLLAWASFISGRRIVLPLLGVILPVVLMYAAGTTQPAFYKFMLLAVPFLCLALVVGFLPVERDTLARKLSFVPLLLLLVLLGGTAVSLNNLYFGEAYARDDYRGIAARIAATGHEDAAIILDAPNQWEVFTYYHREGAPVYPLPKGQPDPSIMEPQLAEIAAEHRRLYALFWGEEQRDPERVVERWLDANAYKAAEEWVGDVRFVIYAVPEKAAGEMATATAVPFGEAITLQGYTLAAPALQGGDILPVTLFWSTDAPLPARYKVFIHLVDANGAVVAQRDGEPGGGLLPTTAWQQGTVYTDNHGVLLPDELPPGSYELLVGLYDVADPAARLPLAAGERVDNAFSLGIVTVQGPRAN